MPRRDVIRAALEKRGALIEVRDLDEACAIVNRIAPEHLELAVADPEALLPKIRHAGAIFLGSYTSEALGDYCAGPNHVLPTSRTARFSSPLGVYDFQKRSSVIRVSRQGARKLGAIAAELARGEGLARACQIGRIPNEMKHAKAAKELSESVRPSRRSSLIYAKKPEDIIRDEIRALSAYHVPDARGMVKLDAMENPVPFAAGAAGCYRRARSRRRAQPLSRSRRARAQGAVARRCRFPPAWRWCSATAPTS